MGRIRKMSCFVVAAALLSLCASTAASAAEYEVRSLPEIGKCTQVATGTGTYGGSACGTVAAPGKGKYIFTPVMATTPEKFAGSGSEVTLATPGHLTIKCVTANFAGEWNGGKTASVELVLQACTDGAGEQCQTTPLKKSEISTTVPLEGRLGFIKNVEKKVVVGLDLKATSPGTTLFSYECTGTSETVNVGGSVIAKIKPIQKMTTVSDLVYLVTSAGAQAPEKFESEVKDTLTSTFTKMLIESAPAPSTLSIKTETGTNAVPLEIKAKGN